MRLKHLIMLSIKAYVFLLGKTDYIIIHNDYEKDNPFLS